MMMRGRIRQAILELLLVLGILISGTQTADVVAEADDMAKRIEEESKKVEEQSNAMASEIEAKSRTIEDASQEKKFEEASKHVDNIMDESEKEVDDKANFAEELENEADKKVDEIGKKIEETNNRGNGISRKRHASDAVIKGLGTRKSTSRNSGSKRRMTVSYPGIELPNEESAGEQIEKAMKDGERLVKNGNKGTGIDVEHTVSFSGLQDVSDSNNEVEDTDLEDARHQDEEAVDSFSQQQNLESSQENENKETGEASMRHGQPDESASKSQEDKDGNEIEEKDATKQENIENDSLNFVDEQEGVSMQNVNDHDNGNEDIENVMVIKQKEPDVGFSDRDQQDDGNEVAGEDVTVEHVRKSKDKENNGDTDIDYSVNDKHDSNVVQENDDDKNKSDKKGGSMLDKKQPLTGKNETGDDNDEYDGKVFDVDVYQENSNSSSNATKLDEKEAKNGTMEYEGSSAVVSQTSSGDENDTKTEYSNQEPTISTDVEAKYNPRVVVNFSPSVELLKPDQKLLNEIEDDHALRMKEKEKKQHDKELQDLGATQLEKEFNTRWRPLSAKNDPEMLLRYPSLGKVVGKTGTNQKVSMITPGEVDFLQTEYPDYMQHGINGHKVELIVRDNVGGFKRTSVPKGKKAKKNRLRKLLIKNQI